MIAKAFIDQNQRRKLQHLSPSAEPSPSLEAEEPCFDSLVTSPGSTSSDRCTVNEVLPLRPNPMRRLRPVISKGISLKDFWKLANRDEQHALLKLFHS